MAARGQIGFLCVFFVLAAGTGHAQSPEHPIPDLGIEVHAFVSSGAFISTGNNFLTKSEKGSVELTEVGINFTKQLTDRLRAGIQLFARDLGRIGNYDITADWYYLDYRFRDWLGFRAGRVKVPFGLYNELHDIDAARVPIFLPQSLYPLQNRDFLLAHTGGELYGYIRLAAAGAIEYRAYAGTILLEAAPSARAPYDIASLDTRYIVGGRALWEPIDGLRAGGAVQVLRLDSELLFDPEGYLPLAMSGMLPEEFSGQVDVQLPAVLWVASAEYVVRGLRVASEYSRWHVRRETSEPLLFPESSTTSERFYAMASYAATSWLTPGLYYSLLYDDIEQRKGRENVWHDTALTLRFDINQYWLVKAEGHYMVGTAGLKSSLNDDKPTSELARSWSLFLLKTTVYF